MKVRFTATALAELDRIARYIARDSPQAAATVASRVEQLTGRLAGFPQMATPPMRNVSVSFPWGASRI
jgi:plasmid stabilization system protein ParE